MTHDVIIIGAGMSGLAAGIRLAYYDKKVVVLEKHNVLGGLNSFYKQGGRKFDVGLHAMTNYVPEGAKGAPLTKLLRQLRIRHDELALTPQTTSDIRFPGVSLAFSNDFELLRAEIAARFPAQIDGFDKLVARIRAADIMALDAAPVSARSVVRELITDPVLEDMIFCPLMYYGSAVEDDMDWPQFGIMFQSIFLEGFARPWEGVRHVLQLLRKKFLALKGELRMKAGVASLVVDGDKVAGVRLENGEELAAPVVLSSAGHLETLRLCSDYVRDPAGHPPGNLSFTESISVLSCYPKDLGYDRCITFYSTRVPFAYRRPKDPVDPTSGVICAPSNFAHDPPLPEGMIRLSNLADFDAWAGLPEDEYKAAKQRWYDRVVDEVAGKVIPEFRSKVTYVDMFTPRTIRKFTSHIHGALYGAPVKVRDGRTHLKNLFLCGTDQGFLGITGAMLSGISMANLHVLKAGI